MLIVSFNENYFKAKRWIAKTIPLPKMKMTEDQYIQNVKLPLILVKKKNPISLRNEFFQLVEVKLES